jgi:membrane-bound lytic murein transglycosylase B
MGIAMMCVAFSEPSFSAPSVTAPCGGDFNAWLTDVRREAASAGISQRTIASALDGLVADPAVLARDRGQHVFNQTFEQFSGRMISADRMRRGAALLTQHAATFARIERRR